MSNPSDDEWIKLTEGKHFSRLLYTNPVCFLCTVRREELADGSVTRSTSKRNVMVLSWLTATNNQGRFMFSINRRRHTASTFEGEIPSSFVLCVPVQGMEGVVLEVGSVSGCFGSKFRQDHDQNEVFRASSLSTERMSKRQRKRSRQTHVGVRGLEAVPVGGETTQTSNSESDMFAINGTVAHMVCQAYRVFNDPQVIDEDHLLVLAQVDRAYVRPDYWDARKALFRPAHPSLSPYLSFFGSQTFGYVSTGEQHG